ncbi:MAG: tRNA guanosine(34) transglycosylase Tgt [Phycisphaerae bacterium]|nr:tRNA guanosine(34) transglycosylase Tgt [Phycisphaerae bacterium]
MTISFQIRSRSARSAARSGLIATAHGAFPTPAFMPVGTKGTVKGVPPWMVRATGAGIVLGNTYHLMLRPGADRVAALGGLQRFSGWNGPMLTDSGGYQAYSLADTNRITEDGAVFRSIVDGSVVSLSPEVSMRVQNQLGADIIMAMDDCPPSIDPATERINQPRLSVAARRDTDSRPGAARFDHAARLREAVDRSARWLARCAAAHARPAEQALFGIVQGGVDLIERTRSAALTTATDLPGYAIGGVAVGESPEQVARVVRHTAPLLPADRPRYLMGVGYERDILAAVLAGVDMFDCVLPTRNGRNANAFTPTGTLRLRNAKFACDAAPLVEGCDCPACAGVTMHDVRTGPFSRGYLRHLFTADEMLGPILVTLHNLRHFQRFMEDIRSAIASDDWIGVCRRWPVAVDGLPNELREGVRPVIEPRSEPA